MANYVEVIEETSNPLGDNNMDEEGEVTEALDTCYPKSCLGVPDRTALRLELDHSDTLIYKRGFTDDAPLSRLPGLKQRCSILVLILLYRHIGTFLPDL